MNIRVLANHEDTAAVLYNAASDWPLGPIFHTDENTSAEQVAKKFAEWAGLANRGLLADWSDAWLESKANEFKALGWHNCKTCDTGLVTDQEVECYDCAHTCAECDEVYFETKPTSRPGQRTARLCVECAKKYQKVPA